MPDFYLAPSLTVKTLLCDTQGARKVYRLADRGKHVNTTCSLWL